MEKEIHELKRGIRITGMSQEETVADGESHARIQL